MALIFFFHFRMRAVLLLYADEEDFLEFRHGIRKNFQFFLREPRSAGCTQCCQKSVAGTEVVHNFFAKRERGRVHWTTPFSQEVGGRAFQEAVGSVCWSENTKHGRMSGECQVESRAQAPARLQSATDPRFYSSRYGGERYV